VGSHFHGYWVRVAVYYELTVVGIVPLQVHTACQNNNLKCMQFAYLLPVAPVIILHLVIEFTSTGHFKAQWKNFINNGRYMPCP
jgi:hypothetical protein